MPAAPSSALGANLRPLLHWVGPPNPSPWRLGASHLWPKCPGPPRGPGAVSATRAPRHAGPGARGALGSSEAPPGPPPWRLWFLSPAPGWGWARLGRVAGPICCPSGVCPVPLCMPVGPHGLPPPPVSRLPHPPITSHPRLCPCADAPCPVSRPRARRGSRWPPRGQGPRPSPGAHARAGRGPRGEPRGAGEARPGPHAASSA